MMKNKKMIISSIVILLPILVGLYYWNDLPAQMATHWNSAGEPDGYSSKLFAVVGIPLFILALYRICDYVTREDNKNTGQNQKNMSIIYYICPVCSLIGGASIYTYALTDNTYNIGKIVSLILGTAFVMIGNYMPKCTPNHTVGIKLPWTLKDEQNWHATHRFGGKMWVLGGVLIVISSLLPTDYSLAIMIAVLSVMVILPTLYSYLYSKKN